MASEEAAGLQCYNPRSPGLERYIHQDPGPEHFNPHTNDPEHFNPQDEAPTALNVQQNAGTNAEEFSSREKGPAQKQRIFGLPPRTFWILIALAVLLLLGVVGAAVGGSLAVSRKHNS